MNRFEPVGGQSSHSSPLPKTSSAEEQLQHNIIPSSCYCGGSFSGYEVKLTASLVTEARGGISDGVGWLLWPSSDDLEAIGHGFSGRSTDRWVDCCVLCTKKYGTFVRTSQKIQPSRSSPLLHIPPLLNTLNHTGLILFPLEKTPHMHSWIQLLPENHTRLVTSQPKLKLFTLTLKCFKVNNFS
jgi:hypothetical protein